MIASIRSLSLGAGLAMSLALLAGCGGRTEADNLADLDAKLTNGIENGAAANAANAGGAVNEADAANQAIALAEAGGRIEQAPAAVESKIVSPTGRSPADVIRAQAGGAPAGAAPGGGRTGGCARKVKSGPEWAERMPAAFRLYPGAKLVEAAGVDTDSCTLRVISFTTGAAIDPVLGYYYTQAKRAGYDAEHLVSGGEHQLGGTRAKDGIAYMVYARRTPANLTEVDIVANAD